MCQRPQKVVAVACAQGHCAAGQVKKGQVKGKVFLNIVDLFGNPANHVAPK